MPSPSLLGAPVSASNEATWAVDRLNEDFAAMMPLPPGAPDISHRFSMRLGRDHYVSFSHLRLSVHPKAIGRRIEVTADLDFVVVTCAGEEVARHRRSLCPAPDGSCVSQEPFCSSGCQALQIATIWSSTTTAVSMPTMRTRTRRNRQTNRIQPDRLRRCSAHSR